MLKLIDVLKIQNDKEGIKRLESYHDFRQLLKGEHKDLFTRLASTRETINSPYIEVNLPLTVAKKQADLMFLNPFNFKINKEIYSKKLKEILNKNNFHQTCYKQVITASALGGCFFRIRWGLLNKYYSKKDRFGKEKNNEIIVEALNPENVFPEIQNNRMVSCTVKYIDKQPIIDKNGTSYQENYIEEHYEPGKYTKTKYRLLEGKKNIEISLVEKPLKIDLPFKELPVVYIPNAIEEGFYGVSDFDDKLSLIHEINNTLSRISSAIRSYTYPILVATEDWIKKAKSQGQAFTNVRRPIDYIRSNGEHVKIKVEDIGITAAPRDKNGSFQDVFKFIDYKVDLEALMTHYENCEKLFLKLLSISPALLDTSGVLSGEALKLKITNTLIMIAAKKNLWEQGLKEILYIALCAEYSLKNNKKPEISFSDIEIKWGDMLPTLWEKNDNKKEN